MITLRPATVDDRAFVDELVFATMQSLVEATWPEDLDAHRQYYEANKFDPTNTYILQRKGQDVGRLSRTVYPDQIFIYELHVLPGYQRTGIGREAIAHVFKEAEVKVLPVRATVLIANQPSIKLCLGMGFEVVGLRDHRLQIQHRPKSCSGTQMS